jgi:hypothetical protein
MFVIRKYNEHVLLSSAKRGKGNSNQSIIVYLFYHLKVCIRQKNATLLMVYWEMVGGFRHTFLKKSHFGGMNI